MNRKKKFFYVLVALLVLAGAGCAKVAKNETTKPPAVKEKETVPLALYYVKYSPTDAYLVREVHQVKKEKDMRVAAVKQLIAKEPVTPGAFRVLPSDTRVLGVKVENGLATVDFSREVLKANVSSSGEALGIQSIVNTLTEFPEIKRVAFTVEGKIDEETRDWWGHVGLYNQPFQRELSVVWEPAIWVTSPLPGARIHSPLTVRGSARVFEATVNLRLVTQGGQKLVETFTTATEGAPGRGDFEAELQFTKPSESRGYLEVFWYSPKDGSELDKVRVPVRF